MQNGTKIQNWFKTWFNSPYYHILYKNRNEREAQVFLTNLIGVLKPPENATIMDLACGKGRHAVFLNKMGFDVTGTDLSASSIAWAKQYEKTGLRFMVKDMREPLQEKKFNCIFNLFTSFGYFDNRTDNIKVLQAAHQMLKDGGCLVIDFLNIGYVKKHLVPKETIIRDGIEFHISKKIANGQIVKTIRFDDQHIPHQYTEYVQALGPDDFRELLDKAGLFIYKTFGNYQMQPFDFENSDRLILICKKKTGV